MITPKSSASRHAGNDRIWWTVGLVIAAVQSWYFLHGYRLSGDDALFFLAAMRGWDFVWELSNRIAFGTGRVGGFLLVPINAFAAYFSEYPIFRIALVGFDFLTLALFALWLQRIAAVRASIMFVLLISLHALDFMHLSPTAFPLQNTLAYSVIFTARLVVYSKAPFWAVVVAQLAMGMAMLTSEYAIMVAGALIGAEVARAVFKEGIGQGLKGLYGSPRFKGDVVVVALVVSVYLAWRLAYPSSYDGNQLGILTWPLFVQTCLLHGFGLFLMPIYRPELTSVFDMVAAIGIATGVGYAVYRVKGADTPPVDGRFAILGLLLALLIALPASATIPKQTFCAENLTECIFLDSRAAFLFAIAGMATALTIVVKRVPIWSARVIAVLIALYAGGMVLHNAGAAARMQPISDAWSRAAALACAGGDFTRSLSEQIDPQNLVPIHPGNADTDFYPSREAFWATYASWKRAQAC